MAGTSLNLLYSVGPRLSYSHGLFFISVLSTKIAFSGSPVHTPCPFGSLQSFVGMLPLHCIWDPFSVWHVQCNLPLLSIKNAPFHSTKFPIKHPQEYEIVPPSQFFVTPSGSHCGPTNVLSHFALHAHPTNKEFHFVPSQLQKQTWSVASVLFNTFNTHIVSEPHATALFSLTINDHHIVNFANLCAFVSFTTIPLAPTTAKVSLLANVLSPNVPSLHKNELFPSTVAFFHIATELLPLALALYHIATELLPIAAFNLPHTATPYAFAVFHSHPATVQ